MRGRLGTPAGDRALSAAQRQYDNETPEEDEEDDPEEECAECRIVRARAEKAEADVERLRNENKEMSRMISAECSDPNGTIWDHCKVLQEEVARLRALIGRHLRVFGNLQHMTGVPCPCDLCVANRELYAEAAGRGEGEE